MGQTRKRLLVKEIAIDLLPAFRRCWEAAGRFTLTDKTVHAYVHTLSVQCLAVCVQLKSAGFPIDLLASAAPVITGR